MKTRRPLTQPGWKLTRPQRNRGHKFVVALVARPRVADASGRAKLGSLGNQQDVAATRAFGSTKIMGQGVLGVGAMAAHRRSSSTLPHAPRSGLIPLDVACHLWRPCDAFVKLSWPGDRRKIQFNAVRLSRRRSSTSDDRSPYSRRSSGPSRCQLRAIGGL